jgi:hypothetical protein
MSLSSDGGEFRNAAKLPTMCRIASQNSYLAPNVNIVNIEKSWSYLRTSVFLPV